MSDDEDFAGEWAVEETVGIDASVEGDGPAVKLSRSGSTVPSGVIPGEHPRGALVFPSDDTELMQRIELRGNNGVDRDVETVYLLTGDTYTVPTEVVALHDPDIYEEMSSDQVVTKLEAVADQLERLYRGRNDPGLVAHVHTHPSGSTRPSSVDRGGSDRFARALRRRFDDFEYFNVIHGLGDYTEVPPEKMRDPHGTTGGVWWYGESRRHELAVYDENYDARQVIVP